MKKNLFTFLLALFPLFAFADAVEIDGIYYNLVAKAKQAEVTGNPDKYVGNIAIPETVNYDNVTYSVTSIGSSAFYECSSLTSVTIPNSVTSIGNYAFKFCTGLTSITIPNSVTSIGENAFNFCTGLTSITIPNSVTSIGSYAFEYCYSLTSVTIGNSVTSIGGSAFYYCSSLTKVIVSDIAAWCGISFSGGFANPLEYAHHLYSDENTEITNLVIPDGVTSIGGSAFYYCSGLTSITIPNSVTSIGESAFSACFGLTSVTIPNSVTFIGSYAFNSCTGLTSVTIGNSVTSIGNYAFYSCSSLTSLTIGNSVTSIGGKAFYECSSLTSVTIPNSVTSIGNYAFNGCKGLTSITIGSGIKSIGSQAFAKCSDLTDMFCYAENVPSTNSDAFTDSYIEYATLHVPEESLDTYKAVEPWSGFNNIVKIMPMYILTYMIDDNIYKSYQVEEGATITPEAEPTKEGYTFSGWNGLPTTMPAHDVTVTGTFSINTYKLTYKVDGEVYKSYDVEYGATITPEPAPTKEGYTFSGWTGLPTTMPAHDVTVTGTFAVNKYKLTYKVDGEVYKTYDIEYGATITPEPAPTKEGYTFSGWSEIPATMPAHDVTVTGTFTQETGIDQIMDSENGKATIFTIDGKRVDNPKKGVNVIRMKNGTTRKIVVK